MSTAPIRPTPWSSWPLPELAEKAPNVLTFLEAFTLTNEDQLGMLPAVEIDGEDAADIAAQWIADNEDVWSAWLAAQ